MEGRLQPAVLGGVFIGVLSALPIVNAGNCCCCLWVLAGGALAAYLRQQNSPSQIPPSEAALVGLMAGVIGGIVASLLWIPMQMIVGPFQQQLMSRVVENPDMPAEIRDMIEQGTTGPVARAISLVVTVVVDTIFGMIGGLLGYAMFKKKTPPPGTIEVLPPA